MSSVRGPNGVPYVPFEANHGRRLVRVRGYTQVANAKTDLATVGINRKRMESRPESVYYKKSVGNGNTQPIRPRGQQADDDGIGYAYEPAWINRASAWSTIANPAPRIAQGTSDTRIPYIGALNGVQGETVAEVQTKLFPLGLSELPGRDTPSTGATIVMAGALTITANIMPINKGDYIMFVPPAREEVDSIRSRDGDSANGKRGRIPGVFKVFDPRSSDLYDSETLHRIILTRLVQLEYIGATGQAPATVRFAFRQKPLYQDILEKNAQDIVKNLIESIATPMLLASADADAALSVHMAVLYCLFSGAKFVGQWEDAAVNRIAKLCTAFVVNGAVLNPAQATANLENIKTALKAAITLRLGGGEDRPLKIRAALSNNPVQQLLRAVGERVRSQAECIKGQALVDIPLGCDGEMIFVNM